mmetsp:Transcript_39098/g.81166  ORF Transcript_39098/g.81166 Transcript_39098/m.81166 type:complete len:452 (-) Transcript_39098:403-1758(-)
MLTLGKLLVQSPKHLHNRKSGSRNWIGKVTTGRRDGSDDSNCTFAVGGSQTANTSSTFVESSQTGTQIGWVTGIGRHLSKTTRNLTKSFGPSGGGVSHHGHIHTLITEVFSKRNTGVNGSLTGGHGHVGGIGDQSGTLHDTNFLIVANIILDGHCEFREITQHFSHLITTFTTSDVDNGITIGKLGKRLGNHSLSATKGSGDSAGSSQHGWEKTIDNTKTGNQGNVSGELFGDGTGATDGPEVAQSQLVCLVLRFIENIHDNIVNQEGFLAISTSGVDLAHDTKHIGGTKDLVLIDKFVFVHNTNDITSGNGLTFLEITGGESPTNVAGKARNIHTLGHVDIAGFLENVFQRTLDTIENGVHDTRTQFDGKGLLTTQDGIANGQTGGILVNLNGSGVSFQLNNFTHQLGVSHTDQLVHGRPTHTIGNHQRTGHLKDESVIRLFLLVSVTHD